MRQAFPSPMGDMGMSLRQWYAGQALQGFFAGVPFDSETPLTEADKKYFRDIAKVCFEMADAMCKESEK